MSEPAQKCENYAIFKQNYTLQLFIALKMVYCCSLGLRGNLDFPDFLQNKFYNINYWSSIFRSGRAPPSLPANLVHEEICRAD